MTADAKLLVEGRDARGVPWRVETGSTFFEISSTKVWAGDFDANGRRDLLFVTGTTTSGRCVPIVDLLFLLYDDSGRPVPWVASSSLPVLSLPSGDILLLDADGDHRVEVAIFGCEYGGFGDLDRNTWVHRSVDGIFEADSQRWRPLQAGEIAEHERLAKRYFGNAEPQITWRKTQPADWQDPFLGWDAPATQTLASMRTPELGCPSFLDAQSSHETPPGAIPAIAIAESDPCEEREESVLRLADGRSWGHIPNVILDGPEGREVYIDSSAESAFQRLLLEQIPFRVLGNPEHPDWIWALPGEAKAGVSTYSRLTDVATRRSIALEKDLAADPSNPGMDLVYARETGCVQMRFPDGRPMEFRRMEDCEERATLRARPVDKGGIVLGSVGRRLLVSARHSKVVWLDGDGSPVESTVFTAPAAASRLVAVAAFEDGWLVQWRHRGGTSLALHNRHGMPVTELMKCPGRGELLTADLREGLLFVRWRAGSPLELMRVRAAIEWGVSPSPSQTPKGRAPGD